MGSIDGLVSLGTALANSSGVWSFTSTALADGVHSLTAVATDVAGDVSAASAALSVTVDTAAPTITSGETAAAIDENSGAGQVVYTVTSDDSGDVSDGAVYSLTGDDAALFSIDEKTGVVTLLGDPDHEAQASYSFTVVATDLAGNASTQAVSLSVNDLDEVAPNAPTISSVTDDASPIIGTAEAGSVVSIMRGNTLIGTAAADSTGNWSYTSATYLPAGSYSSTVAATVSAGNSSAPSVPYTINCD